jgi:hypothetical protein
MVRDLLRRRWWQLRWCHVLLLHELGAVQDNNVRHRRKLRRESILPYPTNTTAAPFICKAAPSPTRRTSDSSDGVKGGASFERSYHLADLEAARREVRDLVITAGSMTRQYHLGNRVSARLAFRATQLLAAFAVRFSNANPTSSPRSPSLATAS